MLRILLDERISPDGSKALRRHSRKMVVFSMAEWEDGNFIGQDVSARLREAGSQGLTLVTYDRLTIPPLLKTWAEQARAHCGVIFVDEKTMSPSETGGLVSALAELAKNAGTWDWTNRVFLLR
jgi:hypothetical protein